MARSICQIEGCGRPIIGQRLCAAHYRRLRKHGDPLGGRQTYRGEPAAVLSRAIRSQTDECIIWPFSKKNGYGEVFIDGKKHYTHRYVLTATFGAAPSPNMDAAHAPVICHNKACINPRHLRWATRLENAEDRALDGTEIKGELRHSAKLRASDVLAIKKDGRDARTLAAEYGVHRVTIYDIKTGRTWGWL